MEANSRKNGKKIAVISPDVDGTFINNSDYDSDDDFARNHDSNDSDQDFVRNHDFDSKKQNSKQISNKESKKQKSKEISNEESRDSDFTDNHYSKKQDFYDSNEIIPHIIPHKMSNKESDISNNPSSNIHSVQHSNNEFNEDSSQNSDSSQNPDSNNQINPLNKEMNEENETADNNKDNLLPAKAGNNKEISKTGTSRLVIHKLILNNFKSYAGIQEIGPFNASFSAVVGPNGSGKSNVIDSLLFVFGFRALKMRQGKLSHLIHSAESGQKLDFCQVDIHFLHVVEDILDPLLAHPVPNSEIIISRRATRNNTSCYYINGKPSNYTDVTQYLRDQGIDLDHKRFLILQGEVESIAQMKAKAEKENEDGLLEYLEDIIGTSNYKAQIDNNLAKMDDLNLICLEKENRFVLVENDTSTMEEKKNEALTFLEKEKLLTNKRSVKFQVIIHENTATLNRHSETATEVNSQLAKEKEKNAELNKEVHAANERKKATQKLLLALSEKLLLLNKKQKSLTSQRASMEEKLKNLQNKSKKISKTIQSSEHTLASSNTSLENVKSAGQQFADELTKLEASLEIEVQKLSVLRSKLTDKTSHFSKEIQDIQRLLLPINDKVKEKDTAIRLVESEIDMLNEQAKSLDTQIQQSTQRLAEIKSEGKAKENELSSLEKRLAHIEEQILLGEEQCTNSSKQLEHKKAKVQMARQKTQDAMNTLASTQNKNKVLVSLTRLAKSGRITGFYGRLGNLGQIDDKYDVAISTACPGLDSLVVDTVETAQACIEYLRKNKLGYANFICLNKLRKFDLSPIQTPGNPMTVKRLFDLIIPKDKMFLPAFYSKLYNTLVATNLPEAKSVAYGAKRYKVVTLDGKVVDTSGTMSGGGNYQARGGMKLVSNAATNEEEYTEEDIAQMREELAGMEARVEELEREYSGMENNLQTLKGLKPETEFAIKRAELDIQSLISEKKEVSKTCKALLAEKEKEGRSSELEGPLNDKKEELEQLKTEREDLKALMIDSETKIASLEAKIMDAGGVELRVQDSKVDSIKQKIDIIHEKTSGDTMTIRKLEHEIKRHSKILEESQAEAAKVQTDIVGIEEEMQGKNEGIKEIQERINTVDGEKSQLEGELEKITEEAEDLNAKINEFKLVEIELENKMEKLNGIIRKCQHNIESARQSMENLIVRDCGPYIDWMGEEEKCKHQSDDIAMLNTEEIEEVNVDNVEEEIHELEAYMNNVQVDIEILKEYGVKKRELEERRQELNTSVEERDKVKHLCEELKKKRLDEFMVGFNTISLSLKEMYQMITMGGNAELDLVDSLDPFSEGILFSVMPPKKSWRNISNLSGGEKTLSSLALVFALHKYKPTPLYVMDEIDAALDFRNVSIVANYIKERTKNAQFIVISLRNNMFELAQQLVGIYKVENRTRSISLKNKNFLVAT